MKFPTERLIEVLVVVAIIAVLVALLFPAIQSARIAGQRSEKIKTQAYKPGTSVKIKMNSKKGVVHRAGIAQDGETLSYKVAYVDDCGKVDEAELLQTDLEPWRN